MAKTFIIYLLLGVLVWAIFKFITSFDKITQYKFTEPQQVMIILLWPLVLLVFLGSILFEIFKKIFHIN